MTTRFEMAEALVEKAKRQRNQIGDHGDPYEEALLTGIVVSVFIYSRRVKRV